MVAFHHGDEHSWMRFGSVSGSGSSSGAEPMEEGMCEFISLEITRSILEQALVNFNTIKEGITELSDERLGAFHADIVVVHIGA